MRDLISFLFLALLCLQVSAEESPLRGVKIEKGMERARVEKQVAEALSRPNEYSPYGNNLRGGTVEYTDGKTVLVVEYSPGSPAPTIITKDGQHQGLPPKDETVKKFTFRER